MSQKKLSNKLTKNVKLLQKAVLLHENQILILKRSEKSKSRPSCWDLPGGNSTWPEKTLENLENLHQEDIAREIKEETNITIISNHFTQSNLILFKTFYEASKNVFSVIVGWKVELPSDFDRSMLKISHEHSEYKWIDISELSEYDFGGTSGDFIKEMIRNSIR
jgi:8-oxo-dGTP diphosphatase